MGRDVILYKIRSFYFFFNVRLQEKDTSVETRIRVSNTRETWQPIKSFKISTFFGRRNGKEEGGRKKEARNINTHYRVSYRGRENWGGMAIGDNRAWGTILAIKA